MARGPVSAEARARMSRAAKKRWAKKKRLAVTPALNGVVISQQLVLRVRDQEFTLTAEEARHLATALLEALGATP